METAELLARVPLFKLLDEVELADLQHCFERREIPAGQAVFRMGEPGESLYIVGEGSVELFVKDDTGSKIVLTVCEPGDFFGELSLFDGGARTATAEVLSDADLLVLDREDLMAFLRRRPDAALDLLATVGQRMRSTDEILRRRAARNINVEMEIRSTALEKMADVIAEFSGSIPFLMMNAIWFLVWIAWNVIPHIPHFDPYPFGFLTMVVSLEAIFLSIFVLVSQNRQGEKDRLRADADYEVNLKAELEITHLHEKMDFLTEEILARVPGRERARMSAAKDG
jgi:CRP/FNR family cyclic AMP-dependent transcriptional regulator